MLICDKVKLSCCHFYYFVTSEETLNIVCGDVETMLRNPKRYSRFAAACLVCLRKTVYFQENGRRQKSKVCETFDHLFALLEERKGEMIQRINAEQEEKVDYIRGLRRKHTEHLENTAKLLETAIQTLDESEMAVFLQVNLNASCLTGSYPNQLVQLTVIHITWFS